MKIRSLTLPAIAVLLLAACTKRPTQPQFDAVVIDTLLADNENSYQVSYDFASIANAAKSPVLEAIQEANMGYFFELEEFAGTLPEAVQTSLEQLAAEIRPTAGTSAEWGPQRYEQSVSSEASLTDSLLTYIITRSSYTGGAHGIYSVAFHTYSIASGREMTLSDLFSPERIESLSRLIRQKLYLQQEVTDDEGLSSKGFFPEYIAANENFRIDSLGGITFYYNPYEIGCYALGGVEVEISSEELELL